MNYTTGFSISFTLLFLCFLIWFLLLFTSSLYFNKLETSSLSPQGLNTVSESSWLDSIGLTKDSRRVESSFYVAYRGNKLNRRLLSEEASVEKKIKGLEKKKSSEKI